MCRYSCILLPSGREKYTLVYVIYYYTGDDRTNNTVCKTMYNGSPNTVAP